MSGFRKVDKFVKEKASANAKLNRVLSPHVTYGVIATPNTATTTITKNITNSKQKTNGRTYSMTVSFYNPKYEPGYPKEYSVRHEVSKLKNLEMNSPERLKSPKRDPILQNNNEEVLGTKPMSKQFPNSGKTTMFTAEVPKVSQKKIGDCNLDHHPRDISPRKEGIKTNIPHPHDDEPEVERRLRKKVKVPHTNNFDIIVEGDLSHLIHRGRKHYSIQQSEEAKKFNDRKYILAAERGTSNRGKVFSNSQVGISPHPIEDDSHIQLSGRRLASPHQKRREFMKSIVNYEYSLPYREEKLSPKCNNISMTELATMSANCSMMQYAGSYGGGSCNSSMMQ